MEKNLCLFQIQDDDRPMWVVAEDWGEAMKKWKAWMAREQSIEPADVSEPKSILLVCEHDDLIL